VRRIVEALADGEDGTDNSAERRGVFKRVDLYKMHTYRDAIPTARSVWILYPGTELRFFGRDGCVANAAEEVQPRPVGVGAIPLAPGPQRDILACVLRRLTADHEG
jgi:predicted component of viral defense system (DUF524 family)